MTTSPDFPIVLARAVQALALVAPGLFAFALARGAITLPSQARSRVLLLLGVGFSLWLAAGWALALTGSLEVRDASFPVFVLPVGASVIFGLLLLSLATWRRVINGSPMELLLAVEAIRVFGFIFLLLTQSDVLPESFGYPTAWGDMLAGWLSVAGLAIWVTRRKYRRGFVFLVTLFGMADAANALRHALASYAQAPVFGEFPFAVLFASAVPVLVLTHLYILFKLFLGSSDAVGQRASFEAPRQNSRRVHVGEKAPFFRAQSLTGEIVSSHDLKSNWLLLSFHRYAACPVCTLVLQEYKRRHEDLRGAELRVVAVFHSTRERLLEYMEPDEFPFTVVGDPSMDIYEKFGAGTRLRSLFDPRTLINGLRSLGKGSFNPLEADGPGHVMPSDFIMDKNGIVRHIHRGGYVGDSLTVDRALQILAGLQQGEEGNLPSQPDHQRRTVFRRLPKFSKVRQT